MILKSPENKTSQEAHRKLSNKTFRKEVENASILHPKGMNNGISRLHTDRDVCKGNTDIPRNATQGCSATLKLDKVLQNPLRWRQVRTESQAQAEPHDLKSWEYVRLIISSTLFAQQKEAPVYLIHLYNIYRWTEISVLRSRQ